ncbi:MAG: FkbM family methyltransferase [Schwartzia succinivorans]|nr:FkbM family methyltransferase [Schwartzia succinivorans]
MLGIGDLIFEDGVARYFQSKKEIVEKHKSIFLFGSARGGERVFKYLSTCNLHHKIVSVVDNDTMKQGKDFFGIKIIGVDVLKKAFGDYDDAIVVIASGSAHIIKEQLLAEGIPDDRIVAFVISNLQFPPTPYQFFLKKKKEINLVYQILEDEKSKNVFISLLNYKMTRDSKWLRNIADKENIQYFDDIMNLSEEESFVDCGTYIGDTVKAYASLFRRWKNYYCFEADPNVFINLKQNIDKNGWTNIYAYNLGCWDKEDVLCFMTLGSGSSSIENSGKGIKIPVNSLDNILSGKEVSVIKMDIEGAEKKALIGANNIIKYQHPKLAISIYHSLEDFIYLPLLMKEYGDGYKIYMRHYRELTDSETICYAV